jgi:hypothetical protein
VGAALLLLNTETASFKGCELIPGAGRGCARSGQTQRAAHGSPLLTSSLEAGVAVLMPTSVPVWNNTELPRLEVEVHKGM